MKTNKMGEIIEKGYLKIKKPNHHRANSSGYVLKHILVAEKKLGRPIGKHEVVHHINGNTLSNEPSNLQVMTREDHARIIGGRKKRKHTKPQWNKISKEKELKILQLFKDGLNYSQIGRKLGISNNCARNYVLQWKTRSKEVNQNGK